jgi:hypothetical protein
MIKCVLVLITVMLFPIVHLEINHAPRAPPSGAFPQSLVNSQALAVLNAAEALA